MKNKVVMLQGTASDVGKSLLVTALCRIYAKRGFSVAPFKSQNMSSNTIQTARGEVMSLAQGIQAEASYKVPDIRMNPISLLPQSDRGSQVFIGGKSWGDYDFADYQRMKKTLAPDLQQMGQALIRENDILFVEGAGSPAEINLNQDDIVNMGLAALLDSPVILVADIDRGGVFAHIYGTLALLGAQDRQRVKGVIINKFRGNKALLEPGLAQIEALTGVPVIGVVDYGDPGIVGEDSLAWAKLPRQADPDKALDVAVLLLPRAQNIHRYDALRAYDQLSLRYGQSWDEVSQADLVILPESRGTLPNLGPYPQGQGEAGPRILSLTPGIEQLWPGLVYDTFPPEERSLAGPWMDEYLAELLPGKLSKGSYQAMKDQAYNRWADHVRQGLNMDQVDAIIFNT